MRTTIATKLTAATMIPCLILYAMGCYSYEAVDLMDAEQTEDLLVGTRDGRCFRLATWTSDSLGNIAGEGDEYASIDDAEGWREPRPETIIYNIEGFGFVAEVMFPVRDGGFLVFFGGIGIDPAGLVAAGVIDISCLRITPGGEPAVLETGGCLAGATILARQTRRTSTSG